MPVLLAMAVISAVSAGYGMYAANKAQNQQIDAQNQLQKQQEQARVDQVTNEVGTAAQRTNMALTSAATRNKGQAAPTFAGTSFLGGGLPSMQQDGAGGVSASSGQAKTMGSSGTF